MGHSHVVLLPLEDPGIVPWLAEHGIVLAQPWPSSRYPTPGEIRRALDQAPASYVIRYTIGPATWDVDISVGEARTTLWVRGFAGDETASLPFSFHKGAEAINLWLLAHLTPHCGPLVLVSTDTILPILVTLDQQVIYAHDEANLFPN